MATLYISIFDASTMMAIGEEDQTMTVDIGVSSVQSDAIGGGGVTRERKTVRLSTDTACHIKWGDNPTAVASGFYLPANGVEYVELEVPWKIAVIQH